MTQVLLQNVNFKMEHFMFNVHKSVIDILAKYLGLRCLINIPYTFHE